MWDSHFVGTHLVGHHLLTNCVTPTCIRIGQVSNVSTYYLDSGRWQPAFVPAATLWWILVSLLTLGL